MASWREWDPAAKAKKAGSVSEETLEIQGHHYKLRDLLEAIEFLTDHN